MADHSYFAVQKGARRWWLIGAFIMWLVFAISSYFVVNKPPTTLSALAPAAQFAFSRHTPAALLNALLDICAAAWISFVALGVGLPLWRRLAHDDDRTRTLFFSAGLGFGVLSLLTLALALSGFISRPIFVAILATLTLVTGPGAARLLRQWRWRRPPALPGMYLAMVAGMTLTVALLPPTSWDALFYHLTGPKLIIEAGRMIPGTDIPHLSFPSLFEMLFLLGMVLRGDIAAKLLHLVYAVLLGGAVMLLATDQLKVRNKWLPLLFLYSTPLVLVVAAWAYNDLALAFYSIAALYAILQWRSSESKRWLLVAGVMAGLMMGLKYTSVVPALFFVATIAWHLRARRKELPAALFTFAAPAAALTAPWLLKNWLFTGNPVYPFLFAGRYWDAFRAEQYATPGTGIGFDPISLLRLPYDMTMGYRDASREATIGPFFLIFLPLLLAYGLTRLRRLTPPALGTILSFAFVLYLFWMVGVINSAGLWQARLLLPAIAALCPILAWILEDLARFNHPVFSLQRFTFLTMGIVICLLFLPQATTWLSSYPPAYLSGAETRTAYLSRRLGAHFDVMTEMNRQLEEGAVVEFLWEPRSYYCEHVCRPDSILDRFEHLVFLHGDAEGIARQWRGEHVTHILIFDAGLAYFIDNLRDPLSGGGYTVALLDEIRRDFLIPVRVWNGTYSLYRVAD